MLRTARSVARTRRRWRRHQSRHGPQCEGARDGRTI